MRELYVVGRVAGLDVGERRIGVAVSDATRTLARPVGVLRTSGLDGNALERAALKCPVSGRRRRPGVAGLGRPRHLDGRRST